MKPHLISRVAGTLLVAALATASSPALGNWTYINLHPAAAPYGSALFSVANGQQVGVTLREDGAPQAAMWSGTADSYVTLNPPAGISLAYGVSQGKQAGWLISDLLVPNAGIWSSTANSYVSLHPAGTYASEVRGINGNQYVGAVTPVDNAPYFDPHASLWTGTAATWVDLNPAGAVRSVALGVDGDQQVGSATPVDEHGHASLWTGTASSWVDLEPTAGPNTFPIEASVANAVHGGQQVGTVTFIVNGSSVDHAGFWNGTAESWVDLNPDPTFLYTESRANAVFDGYQVGQADTQFNGDGSEHAAFWHGTPESWVDLESFLPANYIGSNAFSVWVDGDTIYVAGTAFNNDFNRSEAILWTNTVPEPPAALLGSLAALFAIATRWFKGNSRCNLPAKTATSQRNICNLIASCAKCVKRRTDR